MKRKKSYSPGIIELPSILIVAGWIGLWFLWPIPKKPLATPDSGKFRVSYTSFKNSKEAAYLDSIILPITDKSGPALPDGVGRGIEALSAGYIRLPKYLPRNSDEGVREALVETGTLPEGELQQTAEYNPEWQGDRIFSLKSKQEMSIIVELSGELEKQGFRIPDFPPDLSQALEKPWVVIAQVEMEENGSAGHVILSVRSENQKINDMITRALECGELKERGKKCSGRVTVSYGVR